MKITIIPPAGAETYADALGNTQWRITGPGGRLLVTYNRSAHEVWRPDSLGTLYRSRDLQRALDYAHRIVNPT